MSFVEWATLIVLLMVGTVGLYVGLTALVGKNTWQEEAITMGQREKVLVVLLYFSGGAVSIAVAILWLSSRSR